MNLSRHQKSTEFLRHKKIAERKPLHNKKTSCDGYNSLLTKQEFSIALSSCRKTGDKTLHQDTLEAILYLFNFIWQTGLPKSWKEAIVIPVLKQGRDPGLPSSYMPIALTSCLCKLLEKMINWRLLYFLEFHGLLDNHQSGFQVHRNLVTFESYVRTRHFCSQTCMSVFIDFIL